MDAETRNLALLGGLSLFCAGIAWILGYFVFGCVFIALGGIAALKIAWDHCSRIAFTTTNKPRWNQRHPHETSDLHASTATNGRSASECHAKWSDRPSNAMQEPAVPEVALVSGRDF